MSLAALTLLAITAELLVLVSAQNTVEVTASCQPSYSWMDNSMNPSQDPCTVAAYLQAPCFGGNFAVNSISEGYYGPAGDGTDDCTCSSVTYSMISACGICQGATDSTWTIWSANCSEVVTGGYPSDIPSETEVPSWAYLPTNEDDTFDLAAAQAIASASPPPPVITTTTATSPGPTTTTAILDPTTTTAIPDPTTTTAIPDPITVTSVSPDPTTVTVTPSTTSSSSTSPSVSASAGFSSTHSESQKPSHAGAIAGGVIGGLVALGVIGSAIAIFLSRRRRRDQWTPSAEYGVNYAGPSDSPLQSAPLAPMTQENRYGGAAETPSRSYNPSDPSTFPVSSTPVTIHTSASASAHHPQPGQPGAYNFSPEI